MGRLTIQDIAKVLVTKNGLKQSEANRFASELFAVIQERLKKNDLVKVKGLGTWKVITVEARESISVRTGDRVMIDEHSKITFTPDATMKELVNKPFSQFETVVLNDNVEFDDLKEQPDDTEFEDIKDDLTEDEQNQFEQPEQQEETTTVLPLLDIPDEELKEEPVEEPVEESVEEPVEESGEESVEESGEESVDEPKVEPAEEPAVVSEEIPEETPEDIIEETHEETPEEMLETFDDDEEDKSISWSKWLGIALGVICLVVLAALGGYHYGSKQMAKAVMSDTVYVRDTVYVPVNQDTANVGKPAETVAGQEPSKVAEPKVETPKPKEVKAEKPKAEQPKVEPAPEVDKYAAKDERVRLGAYRIVGLDHEVTVLQGQTFYSICRAHLGPDMECYIEVYNNLPRNPQIKAGQVIKIPKLQLKKRKKQ